MHTSRPPFVLVRSIAALIAASATTFAVDNVWNGSTSTDWNTPANWNLGVVPLAPDDARINTSTGNIATITANVPNVRDIIVGRDAANNGLVNHTAGSVTGTGWLYIGQNGGTGTYNLADTTTTGVGLTGFGQGLGSMTFSQMRIAVDNGAVGTFAINTSGTLTSNGDLMVGVGNGNGTIKMDAGTLNRTAGETNIGRNVGSIGNFQMSGGTATGSGLTVIGRDGGTGSLTMTGGSFNAAGEMWIGNVAGSTGTATVTNGTLSSGSWLAVGRTAATGTLTLNSGAIVNQGATNAGTFLELTNGNVGGSATVNLNGGVLTVNGVVQGNTTNGTGTFNFNGGTLKARRDNATFMQGLTSAVVQAGGAVLDSNGFSVNIGQALTDGGTGGGLTKIGAGTVALSGDSTYTGGTTISAGTLAIGNGGAQGSVVGSIAVAGTLSINRNDPFIFSNTITGAGTVNKVNTNTLTIAGNTTGFTGTTNVNAGALVLNGTQGGTVAVNSGGRLVPGDPNNVAATTVTVGSLALNTNSITDFEFDGFNAVNDKIVIAPGGSLSFGSAFTLNFYDVGGFGNFSTNGVYTLFDYDTTFNGNLTNLVVGNPVGGKGYFLTNDAGTTAINLNIISVVQSEWNVDSGGLWTNPANWTNGVVPNGVTDQALFGFAIFSAPVTINPNGDKTVGQLTFDNFLSYTIAGTGTLTLDNGLSAATIVVNTGSHFIDVPIATTGNLSITTVGGSALQLADLSGSTPLSKGGDGTLTLNGAGGYTTTTVNGGTLNVGNGGTTGSLGSGAVTLGLNSTLAFSRTDNTTVSNNISGSGGLAKNGVGTLTYTGAATHTGPTSINGGTFVNQGMLTGTSSLAIGTAAGSGTLNLEAGSTTTVAGPTVVGNGGNSGNLNISGGTTTLGDVDVALGGPGAVTVSGTAVVNSAGHVNIANGGSPGTFNQTGGTVTVNSWTAVGLASSGQFDISGGTYNANGGFEAGADNPATVTISGTGVLKASNFEIPSRNGGAGSIATVSGGGALTATTSIQIGGRDGQTTASGTLQVDGGTVNSPQLIVGRVGTGVLNITAGTVTTTQFTVIGDQAGSNGTVNQTGGTWNQNHTNFLSIGQNGTGVFNMSGNAILNDQAVVDTSLRATNKGNVVVGRFAGGPGTGTWNISENASARVRALLIGDAVGTNGTVNVSDNASIVSQDFDLFVGNNGTGTVNLNGGSMSFNGGWTYIGQTATGNGTLNVNAGTISSGRFFVGQSGTGTMNVAGGAATSSGVVIVGDNAGSRGFLNVSSGSLAVTGGGMLVGDGGLGVLNLSGTGSINDTGNVIVGNGVADTVQPGTGHASITGGSLNIAGQLWVGQEGSGKGLLDISEGSITTDNWIAVGRQNGIGVMNISGTNTIVTKGGTNASHIIIGSLNGRGTLNIKGGTLQTQGGGEVRLGEGATGSGILNILGGIVRADAFVDSGAAVSQVYLSGGTIAPTFSNATFMQGIDNVVVGPGGAKINTEGFDVTIAQLLQAPTGNGLTSIPLVDGGTGYQAQPIVKIDGDGTGASAIAHLTGGVITSIEITNPGIGYTTATVTILNGGEASPATLDPAVLGANVTSGGLTKEGAGTLTLTTSNTYGGATEVNAGTLAFGASQTLSALNIGDGATVVLLETAPAPAAAFVDAPAYESAAQVAAVPEPGALSLLAAGLLGVLGRRRRARNA